MLLAQPMAVGPGMAGSASSASVPTIEVPLKKISHFPTYFIVLIELEWYNVFHSFGCFYRPKQ